MISAAALSGVCTVVSTRISGCSVKVLRTPKREVEHPGPCRVVQEPIDQDETAGIAVGGVRVEGDRPVQRDIPTLRTEALNGCPADIAPWAKIRTPKPISVEVTRPRVPAMTQQ
jgi:hypothetical protein